MFEDRDEAIQHLTPNSTQSVADANVPDGLTYEKLLVAPSGCIIHVRFAGVDSDDADAMADLAREFEHLAGILERGSKVLLDFEGVESFDATAIETLVLLNKRLRNRGSRIVLCSLNANAQADFFTDAPSRRRV